MSVNDFMTFGLSREEAVFLSWHQRLCGVGIAIVRNGEVIQWWNGYFFQYDCEDIDPMLYRTLKKAKRSLARFLAKEELNSNEKMELRVWLAPDHEWDQTPLPRYMKMNGIQYPGCSRS